MLSYTSRLKEPLTEESKDFADQLLLLLSDNQLFINKIQNIQWNFQVFPKDQYGNIINILFNCSELVATQIRHHNGHVPANLSVYLEIADLSEELQLVSEFESRKNVILSHNILLDNLLKFMAEDVSVFRDLKNNLATELHEYHSDVYKILNLLNS